MKKYRLFCKQLLVFALFLLVWQEIKAQPQFQITKIDATNFPTIVAQISVSDTKGIPVRDLLSSEFAITENGTAITTPITASCPPPAKPQEISVAIVSDKSLSMEEGTPDGRTRMDIVRGGASSFVDNMIWTGNSAIALTAFDLEAHLIYPFSNDAASLKAAIGKYNPAGGYGTEYNPAFLDPIAGGITILSKRPDAMPRILIFLTDGQPTSPVKTQDIIDSAKKYNVRVFVITVALPLALNAELRTIAGQTNGEVYDNVQTVDQAAAIYTLIASKVNGGEPCTLTWTAPFGCSQESTFRPTVFSFNRPGYNLSTPTYYTAPPQSVAALKTSEVKLNFGDPDIASPVTKTFTITAKNSPFVISQYIITPNNPVYFTITDKGGASDTVKVGETRTITVQFIQQTKKDFRLATLSFACTPCAPDNITLFGGEPSIETVPIQILYPNTQIYSSCDSVLIAWVGVPDDRKVKLSYSTDNGISWNVITKEAIGLSYLWKPPAQGQYKIKADAMSVADWVWLDKAGSDKKDSTQAIGIDKDANVYIIGQNDNAITFSTNGNINSKGSFIAKYDPDGQLVWAKQTIANTLKLAVSSQTGDCYVMSKNLIQKYLGASGGAGWQKTASSNPAEIFSDIGVDGSGNLYVASNFSNPNIFSRIVKYKPDGTQITFATKIESINLEVKNMAIDFSGNVAVSAKSLINWSYGTISFSAGEFCLAKYSTSGNPRWVISDKSKDGSSASTLKLALDANGNLLQTGWFITHAGWLSNGAKDVYIEKYDDQGNFVWKQLIGGKDNDSPGGMMTDQLGNIYLSGTFGELYSSSYGSPITVVDTTLSSSGRSDVFVAKLDTNGNRIWALQGGGVNDEKATGIVVDANGKCRVTGSFVGGTKFGVFEETATGVAGDQDVFVSKVSLLPAGQAISQAFTVSSPTISFNQKMVDMKEVAVGTSKDSTLTLILCNKGKRTLQGINYIFTGTNAADFKIVSCPSVLQPDSCTTVEIRFTPSGLGVSTATLEMNGDCAETGTLDITAKGIPACAGDPIISFPFGNAALGKDYFITVTSAICNTKSVPLYVHITIKGTDSLYFTITSPTTFQLPAGTQLNPSCTTVTIKLNSPNPTVSVSAYIDYGLKQECGSAQTILVGGVMSALPTIQALDISFKPINCIGQKDTLDVVVANSGGQDLNITNGVIQDMTQGFKIISPVNLTIPSGASPATIKIEFAPTGASGSKSTQLVLTNNSENAPQKTVNLLGKLENISLNLSPTTVSFIGIPSSGFPAYQTVIVKNTSSRSIKLTNAPFAGSGFAIERINPPLNTTLNPNDVDTVIIRFDKPANSNLVSDNLSIIMQPQCSPISIPVSGSFSLATASFHSPKVSVNPADSKAKGFSLPINVSQGNNFIVAKGTVFTVEVRFNATLFLPISVVGNSSSIVGTPTVQNVSTSDYQYEKLVTIKGKIDDNLQIGGDFTLVSLVGDVLLGDRESTPIKVTLVNWTNVAATPDTTGLLTLTGLCDAGGTVRLMKVLDVSALGITQIKPNPAGETAEVSLQTIERGQHIIQVIDVSGQILFEQEWSGTQAESRVLTLSTSKFPAGLYQVVLRTPTMQSRQTLMVIR